MSKLALSALLGLCLLAAVQALSCDSSVCCVEELNRALEVGERASDENGLCQEYICQGPASYATVGCPTYFGCNTVPGTPGALYPACCDQLAQCTQPDGCSGVGPGSTLN